MFQCIVVQSTDSICLLFYVELLISLQIYASPQAAEIGFQKRPISVFPPCDNQDNLSYSSVRLVINPRRKPLRRNAWKQRYRDEFWVINLKFFYRRCYKVWLVAKLFQFIETTCSKPVVNRLWQSTCNKSVDNL